MKTTGTRYPIAAVRERMRRHGRPVLDFALGKHREMMPDELSKLLRDADPNHLVTPCGREQIENFIEAASTLLRGVYGADVEPGSILPVPGGRPALSLLASTLIRPQDPVVIFDPAYPAFARITERLGAEIHSIPLDPDRDLAPDLDVLPPHIVDSVRFAALNFPNNPTGAIIDAEHLDAFLEILHPEAIVFNDATYGPLTFDGPPWSMLAQPGAVRHGRRLIELHSLAKLFSVGPIAVSFFAGDEALVGELRNSSEFVWSNQSRLHLEIATHCLGNHDHLAATREVFRDRLRRLDRALTTLGFEVLHPKSGMYIVCRVPSAIGGREMSGAGEAAEVLLDEYDLAVVPWEVEPHEYLRFSAQYSDEDLEGLAALGHNGQLITHDSHPQ